MGIGNTTPSAALAACLTGLSPEEVTGRGAGLDDDGLQNKIDLLKKILDLHKPDPQDPVGLLAAVGGLEIAAITGYVLGGAARGVPVMLDGFICTAGATLATRMAPAVKDYLFAGHASVEIGQRALLKELGLDPILNLNLRLGEGTGGALAVSVLSAAVSIYNEMATFESAGVSNK
jgi:nicotinate-nucleotide--dimethylbenzimidazole phosphoribosyltransferase